MSRLRQLIHLIVILRDFLDLFNVQNHVSFHTHDKGDTLDLILTYVNNSMVSEVSQGDYISEHCFIDCQLEICKAHTETQWRECHNIKKMDKDKFIEELKILQPSIHSKLTVNNKIDKYQKLLTNVIDQLAALKRKKVQMDMKQPWYNKQVAKEIWLIRLRERKWKSSNGGYDYNALQYQKKHVSRILHVRQKAYCHDLFNNISRDTKKLYAEANKLLFGKEALPLADEKDPKTLAERFNAYFTSKIEKILTGLLPPDTHPIDESYMENEAQTDLEFCECNMLSDEDVEQ